MKVLTFNYIIADLLFLVAIIMSNMNMRHYEKKSGYQSVGKVGGMHATDQATVSGIFECHPKIVHAISRM
jgi:hypothetical protein